MIDGIKLHVKDETAKLIYRHNALQFSTKVDTVTGEILINKVFNKAKTIKYETITHTASYLNALTFTYKQTTSTNLITKITNEFLNLEINGSFHKLYGNGRNDSDFTFIDFVTVIYDFSKKFGINPICFNVVNLEFGVNIQLPLKASQFISYVVYYKTIRPSSTVYPNGYMKQFSLTQYTIKIYDKGLQNLSGEYQLRFEVKANKSQYLKFANIRVLADLLNIETWKLLAIRLVSIFNELLISEPIKFNQLSQKEILLLTKGENDRFWHETYQRSVYTFEEKRIKFKQLIKRYGHGLQLDISDLIQNKTKGLIITSKLLYEKIDYLTNDCQKLPPIFTNILETTKLDIPPNFTI